MTFEFTAPGIVFGEGALAQAGTIAAGLGRRALVVHGGSDGAAERAAPLDVLLRAAGVERSAVLRVPAEPTTTLVEHGVAEARAAACDVVIALGGGSVIDAGKAVAALLTNPGDPRDYLEVVGR
ncbi:MAG: iron-containing alcohol dehydrogenase, partial [Gemmatirosa sp.]|nr:iron-containing alcohol dehydrogenase [Gemmatirosa sp.]